MSKNKTWKPPGRSWEMDLLSLIFVAAALFLPYYFFTGVQSEDVTGVLQEQQHVLWAIGIAVLSVMYLAVAGATTDLITPPFLHLLSPTIFATLAYFRTYVTLKDTNQQTLLSGSPLQYALVIVSVLLLSMVLARIQMARYLLRFRGIKWDIVCRSEYDRSYLQLIAQFRPLIYPPRMIRACPEGILIEGWFYLMPVPFDMFQSMTAIPGIMHAANGRYLASTVHSLVRVELSDSTRPLFISPCNRAEFISYCAHHIPQRTGYGGRGGRTQTGVAPFPGGTARGTRSGTRPGTATAHGISPEAPSQQSKGT